MPSRWIDFVKDWSSKHSISYGCALSDPDMKEEYHKKYNTSKYQKKVMSREMEQMGKEDINVSKKKKTKKPKKKYNLVIEDDYEKLEEALPQPHHAKKPINIQIKKREIEKKLPSYDKKELKKIMLEFLDNQGYKVRGKISEEKKKWLSKDAQGIFDDYKEMYNLQKKGEVRAEYPKIKIGENSTPDKMIDFINEKLGENKFGEFKEGDEVLVYNKLAKITKITPTQLSLRYDEPIEDNFYVKGNYHIHSGHYERKFKGKLSTFKDLYNSGIKKVPSNYDYKWGDSLDMG